jgi:glutamine cyclotransferase
MWPDVGTAPTYGATVSGVSALIRGVLVTGLIATGCITDRPDPAPAVTRVEQLTFAVLDERPHDPAAFTQGLVFGDDGRLFESAGGYGRSELREVDPDTGEVLRRLGLPAEHFAEGLTVSAGELVQLTWQEGVAYRWNPDTFAAAGEFAVEGEGWGITTDGDGLLITSDGSDRLAFRDPETFGVLRMVSVRRDGRPVERINELEWVDGAVWANVWRTDEIVRIDPGRGEVTAVVNLAALGPDPPPSDDAVLNGIAHRPGDPAGVLWVTGKNWSTLYRISVAPG